MLDFDPSPNENNNQTMTGMTQTSFETYRSHINDQLPNNHLYLPKRQQQIEQNLGPGTYLDQKPAINRTICDLKTKS